MTGKSTGYTFCSFLFWGGSYSPLSGQGSLLVAPGNHTVPDTESGLSEGRTRTPGHVAVSNLALLRHFQETRVILSGRDLLSMYHNSVSCVYLRALVAFRTD